MMNSFTHSDSNHSVRDSAAERARRHFTTQLDQLKRWLDPHRALSFPDGKPHQCEQPATQLTRLANIRADPRSVRKPGRH
jgi:hypothetical protein